ncbi:putative ABC transporter permease subunit [Culicoidibacter larvae]|uniref:Uncharacterized protein n=1 Tax=Culicoidibacter larvae TaxID=2579976 RepID=A0A5R8QBE1_9FIRM|nr:hypothetical protein [Culicoidibacter larvae]TLG73858.1 hypothetical protein FEZ08_06905 [Culicoidibacter larvae]
MNTIISETWQLVKISFIHNYSLNSLRRGGAHRSRAIWAMVGLALLALFVVPFVVASAFGTAYLLAQYNMLETELVLAMLVTTLVALFFSIYKSPGFLFNLKDFDIMMAFPLRFQSILSSKFVMLYGSNSLLSLVFSVPMVIAYGVFAGSGPLFYVMAIIMLLFVPIIPMLVGSLFAFLLGMIASRFRAGNLVLIIGSCILITAIVAGSFLLQTVNISGDDIMAALTMINQTMAYYFPAQWFVNALAHGDVMSYILFIGISALVFVIFVWVFAKFFRSINSSMSEHYSRADYKMKSLSVGSPIQALYKKELRGYFSSQAYLMNTAIGVILLTLFVGSLIFVSPAQLASLMEIPLDFSAFMFPIVVGIFGFCLALTCTTAPSISLEGNSLWIPKSLPLSFNQIAISKLLLQLTVTVPFIIIDGVIAGVVCQIGIAETIGFIIAMLLFTVMVGLLGLIMNLWFPKFNWKSQMHAVKQSASVGLAMLCNMLLALVIIGVYIALGLLVNMMVAALVCSLIIAVIAGGMSLYLRSKGSLLFYKL